MKKLYLLSVIILFTINVFGQVNGECNSPYDTANGLVEILIGEGVEYSNATFSGFSCSAGLFNGPSNIGFESGLVMATDGVESINPNNSGGGSSGGVGIDADLTEQLEIVNASATNLNNLIILKFDFIPTSDVVSFNYVFASNEYPEYTCSEYNDIFGFFLSGPGITGDFENDAINIALVPDPENPNIYTDSPVIINTINSGTSSDVNSAPCDNIDPDWQDYSVFFTDNSLETSVSYPGFTVPLVATANVTPCEEYHIKLAIADVSDDQLNSAVFLQEGSFKSPPITKLEVESNLSNLFDSDSEFSDNLYEGCGSASITFFRVEGIEGEITIPFEISGSATNFVDYEISDIQNNEVIMPDGSNSITIQIIPFEDQIIEPNEELIIDILPITYDCYETERDTIVFEIFDQPELEFDSVSTDFYLIVLVMKQT